MAPSRSPLLALCLLALAFSLLRNAPAHAHGSLSPSSQATPTVTISGTVSDPALGWPLYARVTVTTGEGPLTSYTDPLTGAYSVELPQNGSYSFSVEAVSAGYRTVTRTVATGQADHTEMFTLGPDVSTCVAPGYLRGPEVVLLAEEFSSGALPGGWSNIDNIAAHGASPQGWRFDDPGGHGNLTGGSGGFAIINSDIYGSGNTQDAELRTPTLNAGGMEVLELSFDSDYNSIGDEIADIDVSIDGGATWTNAWRRTGADYRTAHEQINIAAIAGGQPQVIVRFRYYDADWDWWWQLDNVKITARNCEPQLGGLLVGHVYDANTGEALNGATVASVEAPAVTATSFATPDDPAVDDGLYLIAAPPGDRAFAASLSPYATITDTVALAMGQAHTHNFLLPAGQLSGDPQAVTITVAEGRTAERTLTLSNTGGIDLSYSLVEYNGPQPVSTDNDPASAWVDLPALPTPVSRPAGAVVDGMFYVIGGESNGGARAGQVQRYDPASDTWDTTLPAMPVAASNLCAGVIGTDIYIPGGSNDSGVIITALQLFHTSTGAWETVDSDPLPVQRFGMLCGVYEGKLYLFGGVDGSNTYSSDAYVYDPDGPAGTRWSPLAPMPATAGFGGAVAIGERFYLAGMRDAATDLATVLVYDIAGNSWSALPDLQAARGAAAVWAIGTTLFVGGGGWSSYLNTVEAYDTAEGTGSAWSYVSPLSQGGRTSAFATDPHNGQLYAAGGWAGTYLGSAETSRQAADVPWLSEAPTSGSIAAGAAQPVILGFDATALPSGSYHAQLKALTDGPYALGIPVTMLVGRFGLQLDAPVIAQTDEPGAVVSYSLALTNTGNLTDSFTLALSGNSWPTTLSDPVVGPLAPGASASVAVEVTIPAGALSGAADSVTITAISQVDDLQEGAASLTTTAGAVRGFALVAPMAEATGEAGATVSYSIALTNTGNLTDSFTLALSGNSWPTTLSDPVVGPLAPGASAAVTVEVTIPADAGGDADSVLVTASAAGDSTRVGNVTLTTSADPGQVAEQPRLFLPLLRR